ncbi:MAG: hypothetical protein Q9170_004665 [Blastenia crenularia]
MSGPADFDRVDVLVAALDSEIANLATLIPAINSGDADLSDAAKQFLDGQIASVQSHLEDLVGNLRPLTSNQEAAVRRNREAMDRALQDGLKKKREELRKEQDAFKKEQDALKREQDDFRVEREQMAELRGRLEQKAADLEGEKKGVEIATEGLAAEKARLAEERETMASERRTIATERETMASERETMASDRSTLQSSAVSQKEAELDVAMKIREFKAKMEALTSDRETLRKDRGAVDEEKTEVAKILAEAKAERDLQKAKEDGVDARYAAVERQEKVAEERNISTHHIEAKIDEIAKSLAGVSRVDASDVSTKDLKTTVETVAIRQLEGLDTVSDNLHNMTDSLRAMSNSLEPLAAKSLDIVTNTDRNLLTTDRNIVTLNAKISELKSEVSNLNSRIGQMSALRTSGLPAPFRLHPTSPRSPLKRQRSGFQEEGDDDEEERAEEVASRHSSQNLSPIERRSQPRSGTTSPALSRKHSRTKSTQAAKNKLQRIDDASAEAKAVFSQIILPTQGWTEQDSLDMLSTMENSISTMDSDRQPHRVLDKCDAKKKEGCYFVQQQKQNPKFTAGFDNQLRRVLLRSNLLAKSKILENFAYTTAQRNRVFGGPGHNATVNYIYDQITALGGYYNVEFQPFVELYSAGNASVKVDGADQGAQLFTYSPSGAFFKPLVAVANFGCDAIDYPASVAGSIALVSRGTCQFGLKSSLAGAAGADAAIIYDNIDEPSLAGTLGAPPRPEGPYVPTAGISLAKGTALKNLLAGGAIVTAEINVISIMENRTTYNVIAQTSGGDPNNVLVLTAHTDSVDAGPGINDNGSGSIGILEIAIQLAKFSVNNAVRFVWVSAEEFGLLGSEFYVASLSDTEKAKIRLELNFDMIASPNYKYGIYDGDGSTFGAAGAPGSAEAEKLFQDYFTNDAGLKWVPEEFDGRSDYAPFADAGIAAGGLFTGAEGIKTAEEQALFGGKAGVAYDINYHVAGDNVANLNMDAFIQNDKAIAHAVATYGKSFASLPPKAVPRAVRREEMTKTRSAKFDRYFLDA